jgi:hypothetical protein
MKKCENCGATFESSHGAAFWELAQHVVIVTTSFLLIFAVAIGIDQLVKLLTYMKLVSPERHWSGLSSARNISSSQETW